MLQERCQQQIHEMQETQQNQQRQWNQQMQELRAVHQKQLQEGAEMLQQSAGHGERIVREQEEVS